MKHQSNREGHWVQRDSVAMRVAMKGGPHPQVYCRCMDFVRVGPDRHVIIRVAQVSVWAWDAGQLRQLGAVLRARRQRGG